MRILNGLLLFLFVIPCFCEEDEPSGVIGKIKEGFKIAGKFFGIENPGDLAQMVSQTFSERFSKKTDTSGNGNSNIFSGFLRLLGLDTKKLSAIAVNAIIFVAQLISTTLSKPPPSQLAESRKVKEGTPLEWMLNNSEVTKMMDSVKDSNLPDNVVEYIKERGLDEDTDCIQLLICKTAPLIWGMQKALNATTKKKNPPNAEPEIIFEHLPTIDEFADHSETCEKKHKYCLIYY